MNSEIKPGDRVRVSVEQNGYHRRNLVGTVVKWTPAGRLTVREDGKAETKSYNPDHVRKVADKQP